MLFQWVVLASGGVVVWLIARAPDDVKIRRKRNRMVLVEHKLLSTASTSAAQLF